MPNDTIDFAESFHLTVLYLRSDEDLWGGLLVTIVLMALSYLLFRLVAERAVLRALKETGAPVWATQVARRKVLRFVAWFVALVVMNAGLDFFRIGEQLSMPDQVTPYDATVYLMHAAMLVLAVLAVDRGLVVVSEVYVRSPMAATRPIKGYIQFFRILLVVVGALVGGTLAVGESPWGVLSGVGAFSAVLLFIFRDTIMSFIAGLQLISADMIKIGDWIEMPQYGADGDVIDIALYTVKVQNFDKTIVTIPTYKMVEGSFKNWRGMNEFGGRRFKRPIILDETSVRFCELEFLERLKHVALIEDLVGEQVRKTTAFRDGLRGPDGTVADEAAMEMRFLNGPYVTNLDLFAAYIEAYLLADPRTHIHGILLVRQLEPLEGGGLPLEVYVFFNETDWKRHETIEGEMYAHFLAATQLFDLRIHNLAHVDWSGR